MENLTLNILRLFENNPTQPFTIHGIAQKLKRTYPFVYKKVNQLIKEEILNKRVVGRSHEVWPRLIKDEPILLFAMNSQAKKEEFLKKSKINEILITLVDKAKTNSEVKCILLFGSHTKAQESKKSDIDILAIVGSKTREIDEFILSIANTLNMEHGCTINPIIVDDRMFKDMLVKKPEEITVGRETLKSHVVLFGFEVFWRLVGEALWD